MQGWLQERLLAITKNPIFATHLPNHLASLLHKVLMSTTVCTLRMHRSFMQLDFFCVLLYDISFQVHVDCQWLWDMCKGCWCLWEKCDR